MSSAAILMGMIKQNNDAIKSIIKDFEAHGRDLKAKDIVSFVNNRVARADLCGTAITYPETALGVEGYHLSAVALSDTSVCLGYRDNSNLDYGTLVIATISDNTITFGDKYVFKTATSNEIKLVKLSSTKVFIGYLDDVTKDGECLIANISGNTVASFSSTYTFNTYDVDYLAISKLTDSKVLMTYSDFGSAGCGVARVAEISGDVITFGDKQVFTSTGVYRLVSALLNENKVIAVYTHTSPQSIRAIIINISGDVITAGAEYIYKDGTYASEIRIASMSQNKLCVALYGDDILAIFNISGDVITFSPSYIAPAGILDYDMGLAFINEGHLVLSLDDGVAVRVSDTDVIDFGEKFEVYAAAARYVRPVLLSDTKMIIFFTKETAGNDIAARVVDVRYITDRADVGIVVNDAVVGEMTEILLKGFSDKFTNVIAGEEFSSARIVGYGLSSNSIVVKPFWEV